MNRMRGQAGLLWWVKLSEGLGVTAFAGCARFDKIPEVSEDILKYCHGSIGLSRGITNKADTSTLVFRVVALEIVGIQEQENTTAGLRADPSGLKFG